MHMHVGHVQALLFASSQYGWVLETMLYVAMGAFGFSFFAIVDYGAMVWLPLLCHSHLAHFCPLHGLVVIFTALELARLVGLVQVAGLGDSLSEILIGVCSLVFVPAPVILKAGLQVQ